MKVCEFCSNTVLDTEIICSYCGNDTSKSLIRTALTKVNEEIREKKYCENCGSEIKRKNCLYCRINLIKKENNQPTKKKNKQVKKQIKKVQNEIRNAPLFYRSRYRKRKTQYQQENELIMWALCILAGIGAVIFFKYLVEWS